MKGKKKYVHLNHKVITKYNYFLQPSHISSTQKPGV